MKKAMMLLFFLMTYVVLLTGCTNSSKPGSDMPESPNPSASETEKASEPLESTTSVTEETFVSVDYATDELLGKYDSFDEFIEFKNEGYQKIVFTTNITVENFRFIEVGYKDEDMNITLFENDVLYSLDELLPDKPFVVTWLEQGSIPHRGISFVENNTTRYFYVTMSGKDGELNLIEFKTSIT